ncbi:MAG: pilus assembly protein TadG-related protein [Mycobacteriales bacterium]
MRRRGEDGSISLLIVFYTLIAAAMVVVAVDASAFFLAQRGLSSVADGAAVSAAQALDEDAIYAGRAGDELPLDAGGVRAAVAGYLTDRELASTYPTLQVPEASTDGETVTVTLTYDKKLPFVALVSALTNAFPGGTVRVEVTARARSPFR